MPLWIPYIFIWFQLSNYYNLYWILFFILPLTSRLIWLDGWFLMLMCKTTPTTCFLYNTWGMWMVLTSLVYTTFVCETTCFDIVLILISRLTLSLIICSFSLQCRKGFFWLWRKLGSSRLEVWSETRWSLCLLKLEYLHFFFLHCTLV